MPLHSMRPHGATRHTRGVGEGPTVPALHELTVHSEVGQPDGRSQQRREGVGRPWGEHWGWALQNEPQPKHSPAAPHIRSPTDPQPGCAPLPFQLIAERFYRELLLISGSEAHPGCPGPSANGTSTLQHCYSAAYHPPSAPPQVLLHTLCCFDTAHPPPFSPDTHSADPQRGAVPHIHPKLCAARMGEQQMVAQSAAAVWGPPPLSLCSSSAPM